MIIDAFADPFLLWEIPAAYCFRQFVSLFVFQDVKSQKVSYVLYAQISQLVIIMV